MSNKLIVPTVHLNGSGKKNLTENLKECWAAVDNAINVLRVNGPHGRDYYVQPEGALEEAIAQHRARMKKLEEVQAELEEIWEGVENQ